MPIMSREMMDREGDPNVAGAIAFQRAREANAGGGGVPGWVRALPMLLTGPVGYAYSAAGEMRKDARAERNRGLTETIRSELEAGRNPQQAILSLVQQNPDLLLEEDFGAVIANAKELAAGGGQQPTSVQEALFATGGDEAKARELVMAKLQGADGNALDQKAAIFQRELGMDRTTAYKQAAGLIDVAQATDPETGWEYPVTIDKTTGYGTNMHTGQRIAPEVVDEMESAGLIKGRVRADAAATPTPGEEAALAGEAAPAGMNPQQQQAFSQSENMTAAEAVAVGSGSGAALARGVGEALTALFVPGAENQTLTDAATAINDLTMLGSAYIRDEAGTARLAGVGELTSLREMLPKADFWTSPQQNITRLIRLRARILRDRDMISRARAARHSPKFFKDTEPVLYNLERMLERIGPVEKLVAAREYIKKNPNSLKAAGAQLGRLFGGGASAAVSGAASSAREGLHEGAESVQGAVAAEGGAMPEEQFQAILKRDLTAENPVSEEELSLMDETQEEMLMQEAVRQREAAERK